MENTRPEAAKFFRQRREEFIEEFEAESGVLQSVLEDDNASLDEIADAVSAVEQELVSMLKQTWTALHFDSREKDEAGAARPHSH